jgi:transposase
MLNFPAAVRIWLCGQAVDLRRSFDALAEQVRQHLQADPLSGHVFVFRNKRSDRVKLLYWDEDGFVILYKRLERGTFPWPSTQAGQPSVKVRAAELAMLLDGVDWQKARRARRYHRPAERGGRCGPPPFCDCFSNNYCLY